MDIGQTADQKENKSNHNIGIKEDPLNEHNFEPPRDWAPKLEKKDY